MTGEATQIRIPEGAAKVISILEESGHETYAVGGCVRDSLLGLAPKDWDLCTSALPEEMKRCFAARGVRTIDTGIRHGTVTANLGPLGLYEVTTFRTDGDYSDHRHPDRVEFVSRVELDLARRDFTVNAMAYHSRRGLVDPFHGAEDLKRGVISCVGRPEDRFREDALRVMRALRFASVYQFSIAPDTAAAIHLCGGLLAEVAAERLNSELCRLLRGRGALSVLLEYSDVLAEVIPELRPCIGFEQHSRYHQYTVYDHMAHAAAAVPTDDIAVKTALLLHDIGKPLCYSEDERGGHFYGHAARSAELAEEVTRRLRFDNRTRKEILELVRDHDIPIAPTPKAVRRWLNRIGPERLRQLLEVMRGDTLAHAEWVQSARLEQLAEIETILNDILDHEQCFSLRDMAASGSDLLALGVPEGRQVGQLLQALLEEVMAGTLENRREALLARAKEILTN